MKIFSISGYFIDDHTEFDGYLVAEYDCTPEGYHDDDIFFYGLSEEDIIEAIETGNPIHDFIITDYSLHQPA